MLETQAFLKTDLIQASLNPLNVHRFPTNLTEVHVSQP